VTPRVQYALVFAGAALVAGFSIRRGIDPFDEGLALHAAARVGDGQLPYADFTWAYGPGQPYLIAALNELFSPSLIAWRIVRVLVDAAVATLVYALVCRHAPRWLAVVGALIAACAMAQPLSANPFPIALLAGLGALAVITVEPHSPRRAAAAGALCGVAAAWRLDFGLYAAAAVAVAILLRPAPGRERARAAAWAAGGAVAVGLLAYGPFLVAAGPADLWDALVATSLRDRDYWTLPFDWTYDGGLELWPPSALAADGKDLLDHYLPVVLWAAAASALAAAAFAWRRAGTAPWRWLAVLAFAAGAALYLSSRTDAFHETPLIVALAVLLPWLVAWGLRERLHAAAAMAGVALALVAAAGVADRVSALFDPPRLEPLDLAIADGVRARPVDAAALPAVVETIHAEVPPGEPIYVAPRRSDLARIGNPLLYVMADRPNALRDDFPLLARRSVHDDVVEALADARPRIVVRWTDPESSRREPNLRGEPSGYRALDELLASDYERLRAFGHYEVLRLRDG